MLNKETIRKLKGYALAPIPNYKPTFMWTPEGMFKYKGKGKWEKCDPEEVSVA